MYSFHRAANAVGACVGPLVAGVVGYEFGWRWPFIIFAFPTFVFVVLAWRMREPIRGAHERRAMGASEEAALTAGPGMHVLGAVSPAELEWLLGASGQ